MKDQTHRVRIYRRVGKGTEGADQYGLHQVLHGERLFTKPTLLCCGGSGTNISHGEADSARRANGFAKLGHALLSFKDTVAPDDPIDIVTVAYPSNDEILQKGSGQLARRTLAGKIAYNDVADNFMYDYIEPLLVDDKGKPRSLEDIKHSLRNINIVAHSHGGVFCRQLSNALLSRLDELFPDEKYEQDINDAMAQVLVVTGGTAAPLGETFASFTTMDIINSKDSIVGQHYPKDGMQKSQVDALLKRTGKKPKNSFTESLAAIPTRLDTESLRLEHEPESRHCLIYASGAFPTTMQRSNAQGSFYDEKTHEPVVNKIDEKNHEVPPYFHYGAGSHGFMLRTAVSSMLANGINNSIENQTGNFKPLGEPLDLLQCPKTINYPLASVDVQLDDGTSEPHARDFTKVASAIGYNERIAQAGDIRSTAALR